jgi:hypothetical protein
MNITTEVGHNKTLALSYLFCLAHPFLFPQFNSSNPGDNT